MSCVGKRERGSMGDRAPVCRTGERREVSRQKHRDNGRHETTYAPWEDGWRSGYLGKEKKKTEKGGEDEMRGV